MSSDDNGLFPSRHELWDRTDHDGLSEHGSIQNSSDGAVWAFPHFLQVELYKWVSADGKHAVVLGADSQCAFTLDSSFVWGNGGALDANTILLYRMGCIQGDPVICQVSVWQAKIEILDVNVQIWKNQLAERLYQGIAGAPGDANAHTYMLGYLFLYFLPHDSGHFVSVHVYYGAGDIDLFQSHSWVDKRLTEDGNIKGRLPG